MSDKSTDQMLLMAQMMADVDGTDLRARFDSYIPFLIIILTGLVVSTVAIYSAWQWQGLVESTVVETNQRAFHNEATLNLVTLKQNTNSLQGFFESSNYVSAEEFNSFANRLLRSQPAETVIAVVNYRNQNYLESQVSSGDGYGFLLTSSWSKDLLSLKQGAYLNVTGPHGQRLIVHVASVKDPKSKSNPKILSAIPIEKIISSAAHSNHFRMEITDSLGVTATAGVITEAEWSPLRMGHFQVDDLQIALAMDSVEHDLESSSYLKWILGVFSLVFTVTLCLQFFFARRSIRKLAALAVERANELSAINSDLADEIVHRVEFQAELLQKNQEIQTINEQLEEAQNQLIQQEKLASLGQLAAGVAHEINNPVGFINSNLTMLKKYVDRALELIRVLETTLLGLGDESVQAAIEEKKKQLKYKSLQRNMVAVIEESMDGVIRVKKIVQDLKDFSRIDEAEWQWANIHEGIDSTLNIVWNEVKYKAEVHKDYGSLPDIECVPSQLNQVIMNLLVNAAHAMDSNGNIYIRTSAQADTITIVIEDDGRGIPEDIMGKIFDPFFTTKEVGKGTGLGLSLSYGIVKKHKGDLSVKSTFGKGTTFTIVLPISRNHSGDKAA